jgi:translation elongation factor EF-Tu-like GTPase
MDKKTKFLMFAILTMIISCSTMKNSNQDKFEFTVEDVFQLSSGQIVISGQIKSGEIKKSEKIKIVINNVETSFTIEKMEIFAKPNQSDIGFKNDYIAFTISGLTKSQITKGMLITK